MYTKAFSTLGCAERSLDEVIELARRHQISVLELRALGGSLALPDYFAAHYGSPAVLRQKLAESGVRIAALDTSFKLIGSNEADRAALMKFLPWADGLGVRWLRVFDGGEKCDEASLAQARDSLSWWQSIRRERGVAADVMIETHDILLDAARIEKFVTAIPASSVSLLWDAHHTWKRGGEAPLDTWRAIRPRVVHVHVKDSISVARPPHPFTYVLPGAGEFPFAPLRAVLESEFNGTVSLEWEKLWHPYLVDLDEALSAASAARWW